MTDGGVRDAGVGPDADQQLGIFDARDRRISARWGVAAFVDTGNAVDGFGDSSPEPVEGSYRMTVDYERNQVRMPEAGARQARRRR